MSAVPIVESLVYALACLGVIFYLNNLRTGSWRHRLSLALVAGGAAGCAFEAWIPQAESGARLVLGMGLALVAWPHFRHAIAEIVRDTKRAAHAAARTLKGE